MSSILKELSDEFPEIEVLQARSIELWEGQFMQDLFFSAMSKLLDDRAKQVY
jgi:hypothetical protein